MELILTAPSARKNARVAYTLTLENATSACQRFRVNSQNPAFLLQVSRGNSACSDRVQRMGALAVEARPAQPACCTCRVIHIIVYTLRVSFVLNRLSHLQRHLTFRWDSKAGRQVLLGRPPLHKSIRDSNFVESAPQFTMQSYVYYHLWLGFAQCQEPAQRNFDFSPSSNSLLLYCVFTVAPLAFVSYEMIMGDFHSKKGGTNASTPGQIDVDAYDLHGILMGLENRDFISLELVNVRPLATQIRHDTPILILNGRHTSPGLHKSTSRSKPWAT